MNFSRKNKKQLPFFRCRTIRANQKANKKDSQKKPSSTSSRTQDASTNSVFLENSLYSRRSLLEFDQPVPEVESFPKSKQERLEERQNLLQKLARSTTWRGNQHRQLNRFASDHSASDDPITEEEERFCQFFAARINAALREGEGTDENLSEGGGKRVQWNDLNNKSYAYRLDPPMTLVERQDCWYTSRECDQMKELFDSRALHLATRLPPAPNGPASSRLGSTGGTTEVEVNPLTNAYQMCCRGAITKNKVEAMRQFLWEHEASYQKNQNKDGSSSGADHDMEKEEEENMWGLEHAVAQSALLDRFRRREALNQLVASYKMQQNTQQSSLDGPTKTSSESTKATTPTTEIDLPEQCKDITRPSRLFALGIGHAQQAPLAPQY